MGGIRGAFAVLAALSACSIQQRIPRPVASGEAAGLRAPPDSEIPAGALGVSIRRGRALLRDTRDSLPDHVGSDLRCFSCHLGEGAQVNAIPFSGVYSRFPEFRPRNGRVNLLEDRINDCFERSLNGKALPLESPEMRDLVAYLSFVSRGVAPPGVLPGMRLRALEPLPSDTLRGREVFAEVCARCHGADGAGTALAPPVWGPRSFNIGAGLARLRSAAAFIRDNMPNDRAVTLTDQQAFDVAGYVLSRPRPDFAGKENDWPDGAPPDVSYPTKSALKKQAAPPKPPTQ